MPWKRQSRKALGEPRPSLTLTPNPPNQNPNPNPKADPTNPNVGSPPENICNLRSSVSNHHVLIHRIDGLKMMQDKEPHQLKVKSGDL